MLTLVGLTMLSSTPAMCRGPGMWGEVKQEGSDLPNIMQVLWELDLRPAFPWLSQGSFYYNILCYHQVSRRWVCRPKVKFSELECMPFFAEHCELFFLNRQRCCCHCKVLWLSAHSSHLSLSGLLCSRPRWLLCLHVFI